MFDALTDRIEGIFGKLRSRGKLTEEQVDEVLREVRLALLEADVHTSVVRSLVSRVRERAVGDEVMKALTPAQAVVKIVHEELVAVLGSEHKPIAYAQNPPTVIMLCGLQGSGKTTAAGKLARLLKSRGKKPLLVACDLQRPAAVEQLAIVGAEIGVPVVTRTGMSPVEVAGEGLEEARAQRRDVVIVDTAGRLHVDEEMMNEAAAIRDRVQPDETLFVADAMTGQDAVNVATAFLERVDYSGIILTKIDGDARGGAALSIAHVSGRPVKFASTGERLDAFESFHPDRMASRILGMGDVLTLIEKAEEHMEADERAAMEEKIRKATFTLDDFLTQLKQLRKMGPLQSLLGMVPGMKQMLQGEEVDERDLKEVESIIQSMTRAEREDPGIINPSRRRRIATGCGKQQSDVSALVKQFTEVRKLMKAVVTGGMPGVGGKPGMGPALAPAGLPGGMPHRPRTKPRPKKPKQHHKKKKKRR
ncbi:MAG TPA: signal recognition particle protein [Actinomycetota bacterium]